MKKILFVPAVILFAIFFVQGAHAQSASDSSEMYGLYSNAERFSDSTGRMNFLKILDNVKTKLE